MIDSTSENMKYERSIVSEADTLLAQPPKVAWPLFWLGFTVNLLLAVAVFAANLVAVQLARILRWVNAMGPRVA